MRTFFYYGSIRKSIVKFCEIFTGIKIAKYDENDTITGYVNVPVHYMPKAKYYTWLHKRSHEKRFPSIGIALVSINYDPSRMSGSQEKIQVSLDDSLTYTSNGIPYNLGFTVSIATEHQFETDQINEQILPYFSPFVITNVSIEDLTLDWDMPVYLEGASINNEVDIDEASVRSIVWEHNYSARTYLVKPTADINTVHKVINKIYTNEDIYDSEVSLASAAPSGVGKQDEELLVIGELEDGTITSRTLAY